MVAGLPRDAQVVLERLGGVRVLGVEQGHGEIEIGEHLGSSIGAGPHGQLPTFMSPLAAAFPIAIMVLV